MSNSALPLDDYREIFDMEFKNKLYELYLDKPSSGSGFLQPRKRSASMEPTRRSTALKRACADISLPSFHSSYVRKYILHLLKLHRKISAAFLKVQLFSQTTP